MFPHRFRRGTCALARLVGQGQIVDQAAFDPAYPTMELEEFRPLLEGFFARPKRSIYMRGDQS